MAQPMLELECPSCGEQLELDRGFAGGVCRCFGCGTLMTVPADPRHHAPEKLVRPSAPGAPASQPEDAADRPARPDRPDRPARPDSPAPTPAASGETEASDTYTTASGQVVHVAADSVPTARRRRTGVRVTTAAVFIVIVLAIVGACVGAIVVLVSGPPAPDATASAVEQFGYDPSVNPYTLQSPTIVGLPITASTAVIVDASGASRGWLELVQDQLNLGLTRPGKAAAVRLVYAAEPDPRAFAARTASGSDPERLASFQSEFRARGVAPLGDAVTMALDQSPERIVLITGQTFYGSDADAFVEPLREAAVQVDVIDVGGDNDALRDLAESTGGRYVALAERDLQDWYRAQ